MKAISSKLFVSEQLKLTELTALVDQGVRSIICNRPDGEGADQPTFDEVKRAAELLGLYVRYLPVSPGEITDDNVAEFERTMQELPKPVLAFCRTGTRSATLWSLSQANKLPITEILCSAKSAGYDMTGVAHRLANGGKTPVDKSDARCGTAWLAEPQSMTPLE